MSNKRRMNTPALTEVIREYRDDNGDPDVAKQASAELAALRHYQKGAKTSSKKDIAVDSKLLKKQIKGLLVSNVAEDIKEGLHNLLGAIYDGVVDDGRITVVKHGRRK